jgi:acyl-CoA synthetase (AMP-forming)/AMP-acid ligase II
VLEEGMLGEPRTPPAPRAIGGTVLLTSGTTGAPKTCLRPAAAEEARAAELIASHAITRDDVHLVACPLTHSAPGILLRAARAAHARTVLLPRFTPESFLAAVAATRATFFFLVPTQVERLLPHLAGADLSSVRRCLVAGAPFPAASKRRLAEHLPFAEFYGASETGTISVAHAQPSPDGWVGTPPPGVTVELRDVDMTGLGEVFVRSPAVMARYLESPLPEDGFVSVGDLARRDPRGGLTLVDRKHDTIITGGVNVYPAEVEAAISAHPAVAGVVVCGLPDPDWGEAVSAVVAFHAEPTPLDAWLRERLSPTKIPKRWLVVTVDELPIGGSGKLLRRAAKAMFSAARA